MMPEPLTREPVITAASIQSIIGALFMLFKAFGYDLTDAQEAAVIGLWLAAAPLVFGFFVRRSVTPHP